MKNIADIKYICICTGQYGRINFGFIWYIPPKLTCQQSNGRNAQAWATMAIHACVYQVFVE